MQKEIDIGTKSDRELLVLIAERLNALCDKVEKHNKWINGNGIPGAKFQVWVMWVVFVAIAIKVF